MATSLSKIKNQIEKLQKQAASIQSNVISRIRREIAQHGLSVEDLFGGVSVGNGHKGRSATGKTSAGAKKRGADKPAKFADDQGNSWHGIGKRPQWIHDVLAAGRKLEEFLVGAKKDGSAAKPARKTRAKTAAKAVKKTAAKKAAPAKKAPAAKKVGKKAAGKTAARKTRAEPAPASAPADAS